MRLLYNKIFKSNQISIGGPVKIRAPLNFQTIKRVGEHDKQGEDLRDEDYREENISQTLEELVEKAKQEAQDIIKEAEFEAESIIVNAKTEAEELVLSILDEAKNDGFEKGYKEAKSLYEDLLQEAESTKEHAETEYKEVLEGIEKDAINVILEIARKVIGTEIELNKENLLSLVRQGFERCSNRDDVIVKVSSSDFDFLTDNKDKLLSMVEGIGQLDIKKDPSMKSGSCVIETPYGTVDAGIHTKLNKIEEAFYKVMAR